MDMNLNHFCKGKRMNAIELGSSSVMFMMGAVGVCILPYCIYRYGAGLAWLFAGFFIVLQVVCSYYPFRLMRYTRKNKEIFTVASYLKVRFDSRGGFEKLLAVMYAGMLTVVAGYIMRMAGRIMQAIYNGSSAEQRVTIFMCLIVAAIGVAVVSLRGIKLLSVISVITLIISLLVLAGMVVYSIMTMGLGLIVRNTIWSDIKGSVSGYINIFFMQGRALYPEDYIRFLSEGLITFGFIPLISCFIAAPSARAVKITRRVIAFESILFFVAGSFAGGVSRAFLFPLDTATTLPEYVCHIYEKMMDEGGICNILGFTYLIDIVLLILLTCGTFIYAAASFIAADILIPLYKKGEERRKKDAQRRKRRKESALENSRSYMKSGYKPENLRDEEESSDEKDEYIEDQPKKEHVEKEKLLSAGFIIPSLMVILLTAAALLVAFEAPGDSTLMIHVILRVIGISLGPVVFLSLYMKKMTRFGAYAGMLFGTTVMIVYDFLPVHNGSTLSGITLTGPVLPGFVAGILGIILFNRFGKKISEKAEQQYDEVKYRII